MRHYFKAKRVQYGKKHMLIDGNQGIEVVYGGNQSQGEFFLHPHIDDNKKTIVYFAFDTFEQKQLFEEMIKINGIGPKTAFQIVQLPRENLQKAIKTLDVKFFQSIPGIGPKSAKKILLELKGSFEVEDVSKIDIDQKLFKDITKTLKNFGYDTERVKSILQNYPEKITKDNMSLVIKRVLGQM